MKLDGDATATNSKYVLVTLTNPLKAGDKISVSCYATSTPSATKPYGVSLYTDQAKAAFASVTCTKKNTEETLTIDVTEAMAGIKSFYIVRNISLSTFFTGITITGTTTGAESVKAETDTDNGIIYDVAGRPVTTTVKGQLYIKNHKTFIGQ